MTDDLRDDILDLSRQKTIGGLSPWFSYMLDDRIDRGQYLEQEDLDDLGNALINDLREYRAGHDINTVVLGMSGGVDSALTAALFKAAGWRVVGHTLPIEQNPEETERGIEACKALDIEHLHIDLTDQYRSMIDGLGRHDQQLHDSADETVAIRRGNIRARIRMATLYDQAHRHGGLVASTDNFSELAAGFWTLHGDVGDVAPIQSLLKSWEVPALARAAGVPEATWRATPTDGLGISDGDEAQLGASYLEWDLMLLAIGDVDPSIDPLGDTDAVRDAMNFQDPRAEQVFDAVTSRVKRTWFKRAGTICLPHLNENRFDMLRRIEQELG
jgi:NAD+ synthetase